jgi:hypothetical protein
MRCSECFQRVSPASSLMFRAWAMMGWVSEREFCVSREIERVNGELLPAVVSYYPAPFGRSLREGTRFRSRWDVVLFRWDSRGRLMFTFIHNRLSLVRAVYRHKRHAACSSAIGEVSVSTETVLLPHAISLSLSHINPLSPPLSHSSTNYIFRGSSVWKKDTVAFVALFGSGVFSFNGVGVKVGGEQMKPVMFVDDQALVDRPKDMQSSLVALQNQCGVSED